ncbi:unnamed protein product [Larinioides sclopetarius]|uniref:Uncharacterized protein n=1 Tax=Larinioides sclopetarius TaxID=280406 RepID=A0AAV1ZZN6_9ARAC
MESVKEYLDPSKVTRVAAYAPKKDCNKRFCFDNSNSFLLEHQTTEVGSFPLFSFLHVSQKKLNSELAFKADLE